MSDINVSFGANTAGVQQALALVKQTVNQTSVDMRQTFTTVNKSVTNVNTTLNETNNKFVTINKTLGEFKASMLDPPRSARSPSSFPERCVSTSAASPRRTGRLIRLTRSR